MSKRFEINVFGGNFEDIESVGGWQTAWIGLDLKSAEVALASLIACYGEENVDANWR